MALVEKLALENSSTIIRSEIIVFEELGREIVYSTTNNFSYILENKLEKDLLTYCSKPRSLEQTKQFFKNYIPDEIIATIQFFIKNGILRFERDAPEKTTQSQFTKKYTLTLNLTNSCNLACAYCYEDKPPLSKDSIMTKEVAKRAMDWMFETFKDMNEIGVSFYGGEPLLNFPVLKFSVEYITKLAEEKGFPEVEFHITNNGTLITSEIMEFFKKYKINVQISVDGNKETHDKLRVYPNGQGSHTQIITNIKRLQSTQGKHKVSASAVITNKNDLKESYDYLSDFGFHDLKMNHMRYIENPENGLEREDIKKHMNEMEKIAQTYLQQVLEGKRPSFHTFELSILQLWNGVKRHSFCPAGATRFGVVPNGDIYPCGPAAGMGVFKLGNIFTGWTKKTGENPITDCGTEQFFSKIQIPVDLKDEGGCSTCWARHLCGGGCLLPLDRIADKDCKIRKHGFKLSIALFERIKEENELLLATLADPDIGPEINKFVKKNLE